MAESLFDNRYRYDYIYPRGRSGETLRAVDTAADNRPVVVKRPAPNDAPPIRAGQEVSILNERKALKALSGHPVLTEVVGEGQYYVGGNPHHYIVIERATGMVVADSVLALARSGERLPQLELLVMLDQLLDLLHAAHQADIVYNDVDAKHLFWSREAYQLKLIDWGNAVFLEGDDVTPQGVSRQSDVFQVGELMFFVLTGGRRPEIPRDAERDFMIDFGDDSVRVPGRLQVIVSRALHPNTRHRYASIAALREDLADYQRPLLRERDSTVQVVSERLKRDLSKNELRSLAATLDPVLASDPGFPAARRARQEISDRISDLDVAADLDAVRIYINGGNWARASELLNELRDKAGPKTVALVELLLDCSTLLLDVDETPLPVADAIDAMFDGEMVRAAHELLIRDTPDDGLRKLQWLLAERISSRVPEILLLRPNLYRLDLALNALEGDGANLTDARAVLVEINHMLDAITAEQGEGLAALRDHFRALVDRLTTLNKLLSTVMVQQRLTNRALPLSSLDRALNAAMALADNMHVIGKQAVSSPRDALVALDNSRAIDPVNPLWARISDMLTRLYDSLQSYQTYVPSADGSDLADWFLITRDTLAPYAERLFDDMLGGILDGLDDARAAWRTYAERAVQGNREGAVSALEAAAAGVSTLSPTLAGWLNQLRSVVSGSAYVQRHAIFGGLGRALADGWEMFDRGRLQDAEQLGQRSLEIAGSEAERNAAQRLLTLAATLRDWMERGGPADRTRTQACLNTVESLFTDAEQTAMDQFSAQMPSRETYLKAMGRGLVETYSRTSAPALRVYFAQSVLLGIGEAQAGSLDDARFWRDVAVRALADVGARHALTQALEGYVAQRRALVAAAAALNGVNNREALSRLDKLRRTLSDSPEARTLAPAHESIRELEAALREWTDGDFRAAGLKLEAAIKAAKAAEAAMDCELASYVGWLTRLQAAAAELATLNRSMRQMVERRPAEPVPILMEAHQKQAETTYSLLGEPYHAQLQLWYETYRQFEDAYTDQTVRRSARLARFNELFKAMFIDRHPAYGLYQHWYDLTEAAPEFPAPPTNEPTPRIAETSEDDTIYLDARSRAEDEALPAPMPLRSLPWRWLGLLLLVVVLGGAGVFALGQMSGGANDATPTPTADAGDAPGVLPGIAQNPPESRSTTPTEVVIGGTAAAGLAGSPAAPGGTPPTAPDTARSTPQNDSAQMLLSLLTPTLRPAQTATPLPTLTGLPSPTPITPTVTPSPTVAPTDTPAPSPTPTITPSPTVTPTPTLPPQGLQGSQDLLALFERIGTDALPWDPVVFDVAAGGTGWRMGIGTQTEDDEIVVGLDAETLDTYFGNVAPARLRRSEATVALTTYDPTVVGQDDVYFGIMLRSVADPAIQVRLRVQVVNLNTVNLWIDNGEEETFIVQRSLNAIAPRLRLDRDPVTGDVTVFLDDLQVGEAIPFVAPEARVEPLLFVKSGGVIVNVTTWRITLR